MVQYPYKITLLVLVTIIFNTGCKENSVQTIEKTASFHGYVQYVTPSGENLPAAYAVISIDQHDGGIQISDKAGYFRFDHVQGGSRTFRISHKDFKDFTLTRDIRPQVTETIFITLPAGSSLIKYTLEGEVLNNISESCLK